MKVLAIVASARKGGNCDDIAGRMLQALKRKGVETQLIHTNDYNINPCRGCRYECFQREASCPIHDDVPGIWKAMEHSDGLIFAVPSYYGLPPAMLKAIIERAQGILHWLTPEFRNLDCVWKGKPVVVAVVADGGGPAIADYFRSLLSSAQVVTAHFSYAALGRPGFRGGLINSPRVASQVDRLSGELFEKLVSAKRPSSE